MRVPWWSSWCVWQYANRGVSGRRVGDETAVERVTEVEIASVLGEEDLVRLADGTTAVLEIKGFEDDQANATHNAAKRWVEAVNNWGQLGTWGFHVCRNPQLLEKELDYLLRECRSVR